MESDLDCVRKRLRLLARFFDSNCQSMFAGFESCLRNHPCPMMGWFKIGKIDRTSRRFQRLEGSVVYAGEDFGPGGRVEDIHLQS